MLYVHQSLGPGEEIIYSARFHWMYTVSATFWIVFGIVAGAGIAAAAVWWNISADMRAIYPGLPEEYFLRAFEDIAKSKGGYIKILWSQPQILRFVIFGCFLLGLFLFLHMMVIRATTEIAVTNERLIYKKGLIARYVGEINIDRIEGVLVYQQFWGRILGYGRVIVRGMGVGEVMLPTIAEPVELRRAIQEARALQVSSNAPVNRDEIDF